MTDEFDRDLQNGNKEETALPETEQSPAGQTPAEDAPRFEIDVSGAEGDIPDYIKTRQPIYDFETERPRRRRPRKRGAGCLSGTIYLVLVIAVSVGLALFALTVVNDVTGLVKDDREVEVEVPQGATLTDIASILRENGLIDNEIGLLAFVKLTGLNYVYQPGTFTLNPRMGYQELLRALSVQQNRNVSVKVTVIEGRTIEQIAEQLEKEGVCPAEDFIDALETNDYSEYDFIAQIPNNKDRKYKLEGYIFPDTYEFFEGTDADTAVRKFLDGFEIRYSEELREETIKQGKTIEEVINLASIVQKEGASERSMKMVAGVFLNRLDNPRTYPYLQSNATLGYSLGESIVWMDEEDMKNPDVYNTYVHEGLPPSPICNPGLVAIKAVLYPEEHGYYFFVNDSDGVFYFSKTASEHEKQVSAIRKNGVGIGEGIS